MVARSKRDSCSISARAELIGRGEGAGLSFVDRAESVLYNGLGRYAEALAAACRVVGHTELVTSNWAMPELIEAAVRVGAFELAAETDRHLTDRSSASGTEWALGIAARSHALLADDEHADDLYVEAIERLARTRVAVDLARAHLLYGEWLRRQRRRLDARNELRIAHEMFTGFGMEAFAERARIELRASGETARKRTVQTLRPTHPAGVTSRPPGGQGKYEPRDRRSTLHQLQHRRVSPAQRRFGSWTSSRGRSLHNVSCSLFATAIAGRRDQDQSPDRVGRLR